MGSVKVALAAFTALAVVTVGCGSGTVEERGSAGATPPVAGSLERPPPREPVRFGAVEQKDPDPDFLVWTAEWGIVPSNQVVVLAEPGLSVTELVEWAGAAVVGRIDYVGLVQLEIPVYGEAELRAALGELRSFPGVASAFPNVPVSLAACNEGLDDPVYEGDNGKPYELIGVSRAWDILEVLDQERSPVQIGVIDGPVLIDPFDVLPSELDDVELDNGAEDRTIAYGPRSGYTHATGVLQLIAADAGDGGVTGIAAPLGRDLSIVHTDVLTGDDEEVPVAPGEGTTLPTVTTQGQAYLMRTMVSMMRQIEAGATIVNGSVGSVSVSSGNADVAAAYRRFFTQMTEDHPDVLFVFAAGNDGEELDGTNDWPGGMALPNVITVGNVHSDGTLVDNSNRIGEGGEVTLGAPGEQAVWGVGTDGVVVNTGGGTSSAAPMVTAAAALIRSVNPLLSAAEIKDILTDTAAPGPQEVGGRILRIDRALLQAVNLARETEYAFLDFLLDLDDDPLTMEDIAALCGDDEPTATTLPRVVETAPSTCSTSLGRVTFGATYGEADDWAVLEATEGLGNINGGWSVGPWVMATTYDLAPPGTICIRVQPTWMRTGQPELDQGCIWELNVRSSGEAGSWLGEVDTNQGEMSFDIPGDRFILTLIFQYCPPAPSPRAPALVDLEFLGDPGTRLETP